MSGREMLVVGNANGALVADTGCLLVFAVEPSAWKEPGDELIRRRRAMLLGAGAPCTDSPWKDAFRFRRTVAGNEAGLRKPFKRKGSCHVEWLGTRLAGINLSTPGGFRATESTTNLNSL